VTAILLSPGRNPGPNELPSLIVSLPVEIAVFPRIEIEDTPANPHAAAQSLGDPVNVCLCCGLDAALSNFLFNSEVAIVRFISQYCTPRPSPPYRSTTVLASSNNWEDLMAPPSPSAVHQGNHGRLSSGTVRRGSQMTNIHDGLLDNALARPCASQTRSASGPARIGKRWESWELAGGKRLP
jgi:hypothetical protein